MKFAPNSRAQGTIAPLKKASIAQGTIEYLVIIAVVIVIALVVSLMLTQTSNSQQISSNSNKLGNSIGQGGISVTDSIISSSGDAVISLQNNSGQNLEIQKINPVGAQGTIGEDNFCIKNLSTTQKSECILTNVNELCPCVEGKPTTCKYKITYTTSDGLEKTETFSINSICTPISLYTVTFNAGTGGTINGQTTYTEKVLPGKSTSKITATPNDGYDFNSWSDGTTNPTKTISNINSNTTISATFVTEEPEEPIVELISNCYNDALDPIPICTCIDLNKIRLDLEANYTLQNDINMNEERCEEFQTGVGFEPVGDEENPFEGNLNGNNYKIINLYINKSSESYVGLFGYSTGNIKNIGLYEINIIGTGSTIGGLIGYNLGGSIDNSYSTGTIDVVNYEFGILGGIIGENFGGDINNSYFTGTINGKSYLGGIIGKNSNGNINNSYFSGVITGGSYTGGLIGENSNGNINNSYSHGTINVNGGYYSGGIIGVNSGTINKCYFNGEIHSGRDYSGGLIGNNTGPVNESYSIGIVSSSGNYIGGLIGYNTGNISNSYSKGVMNTNNMFLGGLIGINQGGIINNSYSTRSLTGTHGVGGLIASNSGSIHNSYSTGSIAGGGSLGGLIGEDSGGHITNSYWDVYKSGIETSSGGIGKNFENTEPDVFFPKIGINLDYNVPMQNNESPMNNWNFETIWQKVDNNYPILKWEIE